MERAAAEAAYDALHEDAPYHDGTFQQWAKERTEVTPYHYKDGVTIWVADEDVRPWDAFTSDECAQPERPSSTG